MRRQRSWDLAKGIGRSGARAWTIAIMTALLALTGTRTGLALQTSLGIGYEMGYSSNIDLDAVNAKEEWTDTARLSGAVREAGAWVEALADMSLQYVHYRRGVHGDEVLGTFNGAGAVNLIPNRLRWTVEDYYDQQAVNSLLATSPSNRQNTNVLWTGPDLFLRFGPRYTGSLQLRYGDVHFSESNASNQRMGWTAVGNYQASPATRYSANLRQLFVNFTDDVANENFHRTDAFLGWSRKMALGEATAAVGATRVDRDRSEALNGLLLNASLTRRLPSDFELTVSTSNQYSESGDDLLAAGEAHTARRPIVRTVFAENPSPFYLDELSLSVSRRRAAATFDATIYGRKEDYPANTGIDSRQFGVSMGLQYPLSALTTAGAFTELSKTDYTGTSQKDTDLAFGVRWGYRISRSLSLAFEAGRYQRSSNVSGVEYHENRGLLSLSYTRSTLHHTIQ